MHRNFDLKKLFDLALVIPSGSIHRCHRLLRPHIFPYSMPMNFQKGQVGPSIGVVGTNAMIIHPTYTNPITSVPQVHNVHNSGNDDKW